MKIPIQLSLTFLCSLLALIVHAQGRIAITIDDVPNTKLFEEAGFQCKLFNTIDSLALPVAIFINEGLLTKTEHIDSNVHLLATWAEPQFVELGNHTYSHSRYSDVGFSEFSSDIEQGEQITRELATKHHKPLAQFRFPYNDLGADRAQQDSIHDFLKQKGYTSTPFTIESSDWVYNKLYEGYLKAQDVDSAEWIVQEYITYTLASLLFFDSVSTKHYKRSIDHIYLCHDNRLNADCLPRLIQAIEHQGYAFTSLSEVMKDPVYTQPNKYTLKWGVTWIYRWMPDHNERIQLMHKEPEMDFVYQLFLQKYY